MELIVVCKVEAKECKNCWVLIAECQASSVDSPRKEVGSGECRMLSVECDEKRGAIWSVCAVSCVEL